MPKTKLFFLKRRGTRLEISVRQPPIEALTENLPFSSIKVAKAWIFKKAPNVVKAVKPVIAHSESSPIVSSPEPSKAPRVLDSAHCEPAKQLALKPLITRIVALAQTLSEKKFYRYQVELTFRVVESLLLHDGEVISCLMARQMGKSEAIGAIAAAIAIILPALAKEHLDDWKLNITDEQGVYRGYGFGVKIGIYAPKQEQSSILFERVKKALATDTGKQILRELNLVFEVKNGNSIRLSNGSRILCETASEQAKIEGETHHLLILEECQEINDNKIRKSLHPMVAATMGTIVKIGTATTYNCDFYQAIRINEALELTAGKRNHFYFPCTVGIQYNSLYKSYIGKEKIRLGEDSDEFQTSYCGKWIFERGMFVTKEQLFNTAIVKVTGTWAQRYDGILPRPLRNYSIVAGIDWGASHDSTVVTLTAVNWNEPADTGIIYYDEKETNYTFYNKHIIGWLEFLGDNYEYQFGEIMGYLTRIPQLRKVVTDSNTCGLPIFHRLQAAFVGKPVEVEPFNFQAKVKSDGYKSLYSDICGRRVTVPASDSVRVTKEYRKFVNQMLDLRKEYRQNMMVVNHPEEKGAHDDYGDSWMLSCWGANSPSAGNRVEFMEHNPLYV